MKQFLKSPFNYTGTKYFELEQLYSLFPDDCNILVDLFTGGGSVFINSRFNKIIINDIITDLTNFYNELKNQSWQYIISNIQKYNIDINNKDKYLQLRQSYNKDKNCYKFFCLCCSCTNNMMRFNKKFEFNQTYGQRTINTSVIQKLYDYYYKIKSFQYIEIVNQNFYKVEIPNDAFVYLDPPYLITQAGYNNYWSKQHEEKLYDYVIDLNKRGIKFGMSNMLYHKGNKNKNLDKLNQFDFHIIKTFQNKAQKKISEEKSVQVYICNYKNFCGNGLLF